MCLCSWVIPHAFHAGCWKTSAGDAAFKASKTFYAAWLFLWVIDICRYWCLGWQIALLNKQWLITYSIATDWSHPETFGQLLWNSRYSSRRMAWLSGPVIDICCYWCLGWQMGEYCGQRLIVWLILYCYWLIHDRWLTPTDWSPRWWIMEIALLISAWFMTLASLTLILWKLALLLITHFIIQ